MRQTIHTVSSLSQNPAQLQAEVDQLIQFRQQLYESLPFRADAIINWGSVLQKKGLC